MKALAFAGVSRDIASDGVVVSCYEAHNSLHNQLCQRSLKGVGITLSGRMLICSLTLTLALSSCSKPKQAQVPVPKAETAATARQERITLVLSVGGGRGLAHIGAIDALKQKGVKIHSVFGNSMGAVIGGLFVTAPDADLTARYRALIAAYQKRTEQETPLYRKLAIWLRLTDLEFENQRFETVMRELFGHAKIEDLHIKFATSYKVREGNTIKDVGRVSGDLAEAIARSANNPFIFRNAQLIYIDPGMDRISAVPVEDAFRAFKPDRIIAVNVTADQMFHTQDVTCSINEVKLIIPEFTTDEELSGTGRNFDRLYKIGFDGMSDALTRIAPKLPAATQNKVTGAITSKL
jgi:predicted acylesterase/phospholipase RssA